MHSVLLIALLAQVPVVDLPAESSCEPVEACMPDASVITEDAGMEVVVPAPLPTAAPHGLPSELTDDVVVKGVGLLFKAVEDKDYQLASALLLMIVVWALRKSLAKQIAEGNSDRLAWIGLAIAVLTGVSVNLMNPSIPLHHAVATGVLIGLSAPGAWTLIGKHLVKLPDLLSKLFDRLLGSKAPSASESSKPTDPTKPEG